MVVGKIDELFDYPGTCQGSLKRCLSSYLRSSFLLPFFARTTEFSAVMDMGTTMNTGVFVMEPSKATYDHMMSVYLAAPSYNHGDQGFLNWYFNFTSGRTMSGVYNVMSKYKVSIRTEGCQRDAADTWDHAYVYIEGSLGVSFIVNSQFSI